MRLLALSTTEVSNEERYICVVFSESCPNASLIVDTGTFLLLAMLAQECRDIYNIKTKHKKNAIIAQYINVYQVFIKRM